MPVDVLIESVSLAQTSINRLLYTWIFTGTGVKHATNRPLHLWIFTGIEIKHTTNYYLEMLAVTNYSYLCISKISFLY